MKGKQLGLAIMKAKTGAAVKAKEAVSKVETASFLFGYPMEKGFV